MRTRERLGVEVDVIGPEGGPLVIIQAHPYHLYQLTIPQRNEVMAPPEGDWELVAVNVHHLTGAIRHTYRRRETS